MSLVASLVFAPEMVEYTLVNLPTLLRTVMKVMCTIACVPWYNKTDSLSGQSKSLVRFSCPALDGLLVPYILFARNTELLLSEDATLKCQLQSYLCCGAEGWFSADSYRELMKRCFNQLMDIELGVSDYRQLTACIVRRSLMHADDSYVSPYDAQRGHSTTVAELHYGITNVDVASIGNSALQSFFVASRRWQVLLGAATEASIILPSAVTFTSSRVNLLAAPRTIMAVMSPLACGTIRQTLCLVPKSLWEGYSVLLWTRFIRAFKLDDTLFQRYWCLIELSLVECSQLVAGWCKEDSNKVKELFKDLLLNAGWLSKRWNFHLRCVTLVFGAGINVSQSNIGHTCLPPMQQ
ncbi:hypothetical protein MIR68_002870 [Amoeboaphelidium protococcarum]|nr:hypothetical protein MIR68_002870 [Amoeboaphelidium protococcarum]